MNDEDEILRTTGLSDKAQVGPSTQEPRSQFQREALSQPGARKADDVRVSSFVVKKVPVGEAVNPGQGGVQTSGADTVDDTEAPKRVAIIYKRKGGHVFAERLVTIIDETQAMRDHFESLPERI